MVKHKYKYKYPFKFCNIGNHEQKYDTLYHKNCPCSIHGNNRNDIQSNISMPTSRFLIQWETLQCKKFICVKKLHMHCAQKKYKITSVKQTAK